MPLSLRRKTDFSQLPGWADDSPPQRLRPFAVLRDMPWSVAPYKTGALGLSF
jgi:hypothetical protein